MNPLTFDVPNGIVTYNYLYDVMPIDWREEDLLFIRLQNGNTIDVGWYPACDPNGKFKITLSDSGQIPIDVTRTPELDQLVEIVGGLALRSQRTLAYVTSFYLDLTSSPNNAARSSSSSMAPVVFPQNIRVISCPLMATS